MLRLIGLLLALVLLAVQAQLWLGQASVPHVAQLKAKRQAQEAANEAQVRSNERIRAEVSDLQSGLEMVEEKARSELGMVRPNDILVQWAPAAPSAAAPASAPPTSIPQ